MIRSRSNRLWLLALAFLVACARGPAAPNHDCITRDLVIGPEALPAGGASTSVSRSGDPIVDNAGWSVFYDEGPTTNDVARWPTIDGAKRDIEFHMEHDLAMGRTKALAPKAVSYRSSFADQQYLVCDEGLCIYYARFQEYTTMIAANMGPTMTGEALNTAIMEVDRKLMACLSRPLLK